MAQRLHLEEIPALYKEGAKERMILGDQSHCGTVNKGLTQHTTPPPPKKNIDIFYPPRHFSSPTEARLHDGECPLATRKVHLFSTCALSVRNQHLFIRHECVLCHTHQSGMFMLVVRRWLTKRTHMPRRMPRTVVCPRFISCLRQSSRTGLFLSLIPCVQTSA